jgi:two-component system response regulator DesR
MIRVLIAEDQAMVRGALASLLGLESDIEVVAEVGRGDEVLAAVVAHDPDVALLDIEMPGQDGISAAAQLHFSGARTRTLILTTFGRPGYLRRAIESGASGFLLKDAPAGRLADAVREVHAGRRVIDPGLAATATPTASVLSPSGNATCSSPLPSTPRPARSRATCSWPRAPSATT